MDVWALLVNTSALLLWWIAVALLISWWIAVKEVARATREQENKPAQETKMLKDLAETTKFVAKAYTTLTGVILLCLFFYIFWGNAGESREQTEEIRQAALHALFHAAVVFTFCVVSICIVHGIHMLLKNCCCCARSIDASEPRPAEEEKECDEC